MGRILVVDDERSIRLTLKAFLAEEAHQVETAEDALSAIENLREMQIDVVVTDIILPKLSGVDLLRRVREVSPDTLVVMMTGEPTMETAAESLRHGAVDYLQKPVSKTDVLKAVGNALRIKFIEDERKRLEQENQRYMQDLERLVEERTQKLVESESILRSRAEELAILNNLARRVNSSVTVAETIHSGLEEVCKATSTDFAVCFILENDVLIQKIVYPEDILDRWQPEVAHRVGLCLCGLTITERKSVYSENIHRDSRCTLQECKKAGFRSFAAIALNSGSEFLGTIGLASVKQRDFSKQADFLESLANEISIGLKKSMLYEKLEQKTSELQKTIIQIQETESDRSKLQSQLQKAQKMEAIGTLAAGIAHDFNNILAAIIGYSELAMLDLSSGSKAADKIRLALSAADRAKDLVRQILAFGRQGEDERKPVSMVRITKEVIKFLRASLPSTINIHGNISSNIPSVMADPGQIHQIIMNLCTNAGYAMRGKGGILSLSLGRISLNCTRKFIHPDLKTGDYIKLSVADTGHGISQEIIERIFEPYFTTKGLGEGTGLGLAVTHGIIKKYDGAITVESEPGKGTTFDVYLPVIPSDAISEDKFHESIPKGNERVLFVDDEMAIVDIARQTLEYLGYKVSSRTSSLEALALFRSKPNEFDLIITDMTMPNMTGDVLAERIWQLRPEVPVILCTGFSENLRGQKTLTHGIKALLMKPLTSMELAKTIRSVLDSDKKK